MHCGVRASKMFFIKVTFSCIFWLSMNCWFLFLVAGERQIRNFNPITRASTVIMDISNSHSSLGTSRITAMCARDEYLLAAGFSFWIIVIQNDSWIGVLDIQAYSTASCTNHLHLQPRSCILKTSNVKMRRWQRLLNLDTPGLEVHILSFADFYLSSTSVAIQKWMRRSSVWFDNIALLPSSKICIYGVCGQCIDWLLNSFPSKESQSWRRLSHHVYNWWLSTCVSDQHWNKFRWFPCLWVISSNRKD